MAKKHFASRDIAGARADCRYAARVGRNVIPLGAFLQLPTESKCVECSRLAEVRLAEFIAALYSYVQEPGWYMMKPSNSRYLASYRISTLFREEAAEIEELCGKYLCSDGAISSYFQDNIKDIVKSDAWQNEVRSYIVEMGSFSIDSHVLFGNGL